MYLVPTVSQLKHQGCFKQAWSPQLQFMTMRDVQNSSYLQLEGKLRVNFSNYRQGKWQAFLVDNNCYKYKHSRAS